jgi:hypothetical protein
MFDTYGPFTLEKGEHHKEGIDRLYHEGFRRDETENLESGIGVYIIASQGPDGELVPQYVGRTEYEFGTRFKQHFDKGKFMDLANEGSIKIFLIARAIDGRIVTKDEATERDVLLVQQLEQDLIDHCVKLNKMLLNIRNRKKREVYVAGYRGDNPAKRHPAAEALGKLLHT